MAGDPLERAKRAFNQCERSEHSINASEASTAGSASEASYVIFIGVFLLVSWVRIFSDQFESAVMGRLDGVRSAEIADSKW